MKSESEEGLERHGIEEGREKYLGIFGNANSIALTRTVTIEEKKNY